MFLKIKRKISDGKFCYTIDDDNVYYGESNFTFGVLLRKLSITNTEKNYTYKLIQDSIFQQIIYLCGLWMLPIDLFPKYKVFLNNKCIGATKVSFFTPLRKVYINENEYELCIHSNNYISIMKNNIQIALIKKDSFTEMEQHRYDVIYDNKNESDVGILFLLIDFIDIIYFPSKNRISYYKYETTIGKDKYYLRTLWTAEE